MKIPAPSASGPGGFTLLEVVLAVVISVGLLTGVLVFIGRRPCSGKRSSARPTRCPPCAS